MEFLFINTRERLIFVEFLALNLVIVVGHIDQMSGDLSTGRQFVYNYQSVTVPIIPHTFVLDEFLDESCYNKLTKRVLLTIASHGF